MNGAVVRFSRSCIGIMHNKFCIIDDRVITGSYNWTYYANNNQENIIVTDERSLVKSYTEQFDKMFIEGYPILLPYEHLKWTDVKETDYYDLRRDIFRDLIAKNDEDKESKRIKFINIDNSYKIKNAIDLKNESFPSLKTFRTISDVLICRSRDYTFELWEENTSCDAMNDILGYEHLGKWYYEPVALKKDNNHYEYIEGYLITDRYDDWSEGLKLKVYDIDFIATIKMILNGQEMTNQTIGEIPDKVLCIENARMFFYPFAFPKFNKLNSKIFRNDLNRKISGIYLFGIAKDDNKENVSFYKGWDPQERGKKIEKELFE